MEQFAGNNDHGNHAFLLIIMMVAMASGILSALRKSQYVFDSVVNSI